MLTKKYLSKVVELSNPIDGIYTIGFESMGRPYKYLPGQFLHLSIDSEYDGVGQWPESRCFSMQSNPEENYVRITYSVIGNYTKLMKKSLAVGKEVWLKMPYGDLFQQPHNKTNTVFIAGGTGITPYLSLFSDKLFEDYVNPTIYLGFRNRKYNIYEGNLNKVSSKSAVINYYYQNENGVVDISDIFVKHGPKVCYFISGPQEMIKSFKNYLSSHDVPASYILTDDWA